jgi:small subunit ribosomal protein S4
MLKGARCETAKCPMERQWRNNPPGQHNWRRRRASEYGIRLREKQKVKRYYGVFERQFMRYFRSAERQKANTGAALLGLLERRLDNVVYKLGLAPSRASARLTVGHGHVYVNGRRVNRPSLLVKAGDKVTIKPADKSKNLIRARLEELGEPSLQNWLALDIPQLEGTVLAMPTRDDVMIPVEVNLIVELCSR